MCHSVDPVSYTHLDVYKRQISLSLSLSPPSYHSPSFILLLLSVSLTRALARAELLRGLLESKGKICQLVLCVILENIILPYRFLNANSQKIQKKLSLLAIRNTLNYVFVFIGIIHSASTKWIRLSAILSYIGEGKCHLIYLIHVM